MNCRFCNLAAADRIISDTVSAAAILSNPRMMPGHTLVIPKRHIEYPGELTERELIECFALIEEIRAKLLQSNVAVGVDIRQNYRPFLPESRVKVDHLHFHIMPRTPEDELHQRSMRFEKDIFIDLSRNERQEITKLLKPES